MLKSSNGNMSSYSCNLLALCDEWLVGDLGVWSVGGRVSLSYRCTILDCAQKLCMQQNPEKLGEGQVGGKCNLLHSI